MHKIAETSSVAFAILILSAACFAKICHWRQLGVEWSACSIMPGYSLGWRKETEGVAYLHTNVRSNYRQLLVLPSPTRISHRHSQLNGHPHCRTPEIEGDKPHSSRDSVQTHMQFKQMPKLGEFDIKIFVNRIKTLLQLSVRQFANGVVGWVVVHVG